MKNLLEERAYMALMMAMEKQSDRELLELAARASGIEIKYLSDGTPYNRRAAAPWNPLFRDGDALRLAAKLHMSVSFGPIQSHACTIAGSLRGAQFLEQHKDYDWCVASATRRAIVNAAAEIGRRMQDVQSTSNLPEDNYEKTQAEAFYGDRK